MIYNYEIDWYHPDKDCYTLPNGECVSNKDCMHGPAIEGEQ